MTEPADRLAERVLVLMAQAGDEAAFEQLVVKFGPRLRYFLRRMLAQPDRSEDILQDVWIQVFRGLPSLADAGAFRTWLYRIARDRAYREFRKRSAPVQLRDDLHFASVAERSVEMPLEDIEQLHIALDRLAEEHREVLVLRFLEDLSYEEIARVIHAPLGTVRSRIHYAKLALHDILKRDELKRDER